MNNKVHDTFLPSASPNSCRILPEEIFLEHPIRANSWPYSDLGKRAHNSEMCLSVNIKYVD